MTKSDQDRAIDLIKAAKPASLPSGKEWAKSKRADRMLEQLLKAAGEAPGRESRPSRRPAARTWTRRRVGIAVSAAVAMAIAVLLAVVVEWGEKEQSPFAQVPTTIVGGPESTVSSDVPTPVVGVTKLSAVEHLMPVLESVMFGDRPTTTESAGMFELAIAQGLITPEEIAAGAETVPMSQGEYAVLLWRAFSELLPEDIAVAGGVIANGSPDERRAVEGLERAGILRASDSPFVVEDSLTTAVESRLLDRIDKTVHGRPSS